MGLTNSKYKKNIIDLNNFYDNLVDFECCVCFNERKSKMKRVFCGHLICDKCYKRLKEKKCPICREDLKIIEKEPIYSCYVSDPYQENLNIDKKEIIEQLDIYNVKQDDVNLIINNIGKLAIIGILHNKNACMIVYYPNFYKKSYQIIENIFDNFNKIILKTLIDDLKNSDYDVWYNDKESYNKLTI